MFALVTAELYELDRCMTGYWFICVLYTYFTTSSVWSILTLLSNALVISHSGRVACWRNGYSMWSRGRLLDCRPLHCPVTILGKLFTSHTSCGSKADRSL